MLIIQKSKFDLKVSTLGEVTISWGKKFQSFIICCEKVNYLVEILSYIPYCFKLRPVPYKHQVLISGLGIAHYNIIKCIVQCFMCHQLPLEFIASITDYKQHVFLLIINICLV